jgi:hypothetical protein
MGINIYFKGELKGYVNNDNEIIWKGLNLNDFLDEAVGSIVEEETDDGDVLFVKKPAEIDKKLIHLFSMGFDIKVENKEEKSKQSNEDILIDELEKALKSKENRLLELINKEVDRE